MISLECRTGKSHFSHFINVHLNAINPIVVERIIHEEGEATTAAKTDSDSSVAMATA
jgi:hypothetical protein